MLLWLDILIGLVVILLAVSLVIMILTQMIVALLNLRGTNLKKGIRTLLENSSDGLKDHAGRISAEVLSHPLISTTMVKYRPWCYASVIRREELINIIDLLAKSGEADWQKCLQSNLDAVKRMVDQWFDSMVDRVKQFFVKRTRIWTVLFSVIVALVLHLDIFQIFEQISNDPELRAKLIVYSEAITQHAEAVMDTSDESSLAELKERLVLIRNELDAASFQLIPDPYPGWNYRLNERHLWGVLMMAALLSLGAPFWFNALKTLSSLRPLMAKEEEEERSKQKGRLKDKTKT